MAKPSRSAPRKSSERHVKPSGSAKGHTEQNSESPTLGKSEQRSTYSEAVAIYEQALRTLQQHNYPKAAELLRHVINGFPQERELLERSRLYLGLCERHLQPSTAEPGNTQERVYAATLALNAGAPDKAIGYLKRVVSDEPSNDQALYMLAVAHAERREPALAIPYLEQAIEANPENRSLARVDPDLEVLRRDDRVKALLEGSSTRPRKHGHGNTETRSSR
jgi:tetratricopeptide (TPR) repeat protein